MRGFGRDILTTSYKEVTSENVIPIIQAAMPIFQQNAMDCDFLLRYDAGNQPLQRENEKKVMPWIDCQAVDNVAHEMVDFWQGHLFGNPITIVQRGDSEQSEKKADGIRNLNNYYVATGSARDQQEMAKYILVCGHCYTLTEINKEWEEGESYFTHDVLDPRNAFVVRSMAYQDRRVILGVSLYKATENNYVITAYSKDNVYQIYAEKLNKPIVSTERLNEWQRNYSWIHVDKSGYANPMRKVCITEWYCNHNRMGIFENQLSALDNINLLVSDISNGFEQNIQAIWWSNNVDFPTKIVKDAEGNEIEVPVKPKNGEWLDTASTKDGGNPTIQPLTIDYHLEEMQNSYIQQRDLALQRAHVPMRNETSGGSSGVAMDSASGWADAEVVATSREEVIKGCFMDEIKVVLAVLRESMYIDKENPVLSLNSSDIRPYIDRPRSSDVVSRVNAISTLLSHGFALEDAISTIRLFSDSTEVVSRSGEGVKKYQENTVWGEGKEETAPNNDRLSSDLSDQYSESTIMKNSLI